MNASMQCLTEEELIAYLSGDLLSAERTTHFLQCQQCQETRDQIRSDLDVIRAVAGSSSRHNSDFSESEFPKPSWATPPVAQSASGREEGRLSVGMQVGSYTIIRLLGRGGQSEAYLVRQSDKGEDSPRFVLKVARTTDAHGRQLSPPRQEQSFANLRAEEQTLYKLQGIPGTLQFVTAGQVALGTGEPEPYLVTDYLRGQTLQQRAGEFADPQRAVLLVTKIAEVMSRVHRIGLVHGDLKPQNIMLSDDDSPTVIDFGLARVRDVWNQGDVNEWQGGTIQYMAPEQATGEHARIGSATDVFALGAILQQLVTQEKLYEGEHWKSCLEEAKAGRIHVAEGRAFGQRQLQKVVTCCLAREPERRYANGSAVAEALRGVRFSKLPPWHFFGWSILAASIVVAVFWFNFNQPVAKQNRSDPAVPTLESLIPGLLGSDDLNVGDWNKKLPVVVGNRLRVEAEAPANTLWFLVWIDGARKVYVYTKDSPDDPILTEPAEGGTQERVIWPRLNAETITISGSGGTELIMLIGFPADHPTSEAEITENIQTSLNTANAWPDIPETILIRFDDQRIQSLSPSGTLRGPGEIQRSAYRQVESTINSIRESIGQQARFMRGEAFRVLPNAE